MSFSLSTLNDYTNENKVPLITKVHFGSKTAQLIPNKQSGIKYKEALNLLETTINFQDGNSGCGWSANGTTTLSQRTIIVGSVLIQEALCPKTLNKKWTSHLLAQGNKDNESIPFEAEFATAKAEGISDELEVAIWQGDTAISGTSNYKYFDGFLKIVSGTTGYVTGNTGSYTAITSDNILALVDSEIDNIPSAILKRKDKVMFMGLENFRIYTKALVAANYYHFNPSNMGAEQELFHPGTDVKVIGVPGLNDTDKIVTTYLGNLYHGFDLEGEEESFSIEYATEAKEVRFEAAFKYGVQIAWPSHVVYFTLA